ncbi:MAG: hypothetical protein AB7T20_13340 [Steroidobacteraceae bacterium]
MSRAILTSALASGFLLLAPKSLIAAPPDYALERQHLSTLYYPLLKQEFEQLFADSGLAPPDIERAAKILVDGYTSCLVDVLSTDVDPRSLLFLDLLSQRASLEEMDAALKRIDPTADIGFIEALEPQFMECTFASNQEAGLTRKR